jgi:hypothetical protein
VHRVEYPLFGSASASVAPDDKKWSRMNWHVSPLQHQKEMHAAHGNTTTAPVALPVVAVTKQPRSETVKTKDALHLIGCPNNHTGKVRMLTSGASQGRRCYKCTACGTSFTQMAPALMIERSIGYTGRHAKIHATPTRLIPELGDGPKVHASLPTRNIGDVKIRFHSSDGMGSCEAKRRRYLRMHMRNTDILGGSESGIHDDNIASVITTAKWDRQINADMFHAGHHRTKTGVYLLFSRSSDFTNPTQRYPAANQTTQTQLLVVDVELHDIPLRVMVTHGPACDHTPTKIAHYEKVLKEMSALLQADTVSNA